MATGFPNKKWFFFPVGWKMLGKKKGKFKSSDGFSSIHEYTVHAFCHTKASVGKDKDGLFLYCSHCMIKLH